MKKLIVILCCLSVAVMELPAQEPAHLLERVRKIGWSSPKRTGIQSLDEVYSLSDELYRSIGDMATNLPMYSLRSILDSRGDTVAILVVDQFNRPYDSFSAFEQWSSGLTHLTNIATNATALCAKYVNLSKDLPGIVGNQGFKSIGILNDLRKNSGKVTKMTTELIPMLKEAYTKRGNRLKEYRKAQSALTPDDGFVTTGFDHIPEFDPADMPSDAELDIILAQERSRR